MVVDTIPSIVKDISNGRSSSFWYDPQVEDEETLINQIPNHVDIINGDNCLADQSINGKLRLYETIKGGNQLEMEGFLSRSKGLRSCQR